MRPSLWEQTLLKVGWTLSLQGTDGYPPSDSFPHPVCGITARVTSELPPCLGPGEERNNILCLHELFLKCCVFNLMLRVTNYLNMGAVLFVECASTLFKCELCDFSMTSV